MRYGQMIHLGVDYGTANTRISFFDGNSLPTPLKIARGASLLDTVMPSACWIDRSGNIVVGEEASARPNRLKFIKRYWQSRREDEIEQNPWRNSHMTLRGVTFTCEQMVEKVLGEAITRALSALGNYETHNNPFSANVVCPVTFDCDRRHALAKILANRGAKEITLSNVIDEPLAAAVLYGRVSATPPVNRDLLVFDAGAGTVDLAIVRYHEEGGEKRVTVLAEQGRCKAGGDLDRAMERLLFRKIAAITGIENRQGLYAAYSPDIEAGRVAYEDDCEQLKIDLSNRPQTSWIKNNFLGQPALNIPITLTEFTVEANDVFDTIKGAIQSLLMEAKAFVENFDGLDLAVFVGGTSRLPAIREIATKHCKDAVVIENRGYFDELLATAIGVGFDKDFRDLVIKRPPYTTEIRIVMQDMSTRTLTVNRAFEAFDWRQSFVTTVPYFEMKSQFDAPIESVQVFFISPTGETLKASRSALPPTIFRGHRYIRARLDIKGRLSIEAGGAEHTIRMPYFAQVGLRPPRTFDPRRLNLPDVLPEEN
jgi:actin-like ATPase involved in cell morphogenesis